MKGNPALCTFFSKLPDLSRATIGSSRVGKRVILLAGIASLAILALPACASQVPDLTQKSLEDLMSIKITSVSKKEQKTSEVAAAIFVISREDIRHSGAINIPDLLRMVPGLDVAQIDAGNWAISSRGFNGQYSNKLLVLVDGRTVYSPIFAGVFWDAQNVPLDSIERIEVIRGPGAAIWGSNAVNGVINIITLSAGDTQGGYIAAGAGGAASAQRRFVTVGRRAVSEPIACRRRASTSTRSPTTARLDGHDDWRLAHGGFRTDAALSTRDSLTSEGEIYQGNAGEIAFFPTSLVPPENATAALRDRYSGGTAHAVEAYLFTGFADIAAGLFRSHGAQRFHLQPWPEHLRHRLSAPYCVGCETGCRLGAWIPRQFG